MTELCYLENKNLCKRGLVVEELKKLVKDVECEDKPPLCNSPEVKEEKKSDDWRCYCGNAPGYHEHVMMDGQRAKKVRSEAENTYKPVGLRWCPPCNPIRPLLDPIHFCYRADVQVGQESVPARNGMPQEPASQLSNGNAPAQQNGTNSSAPVGSHGDDVFGGQNCPSVHPPPTRTQFFCPPEHMHWSPPITTQCRYPNTCVASCFHHPAVNDWLYPQPSYRSFLQNVDDKPFKRGF